MSKKHIQKAFAFSTCRDDIKASGQQKPAVSASWLKEESWYTEHKSEKKKWDDDCIKYDLFLLQSQETSLAPSAQWMFCNVIYRNNSVAP